MSYLVISTPGALLLGGVPQGSMPYDGYTTVRDGRSVLDCPPSMRSARFFGCSQNRVLKVMATCMPGGNKLFVSGLIGRSRRACGLRDVPSWALSDAMFPVLNEVLVFVSH